MIHAELLRDEFGRLVLEIFVGKQPPSTLTSDWIGAALMQCEFVRCINSETGNILGEFKRMDKPKEKLE